MHLVEPYSGSKHSYFKRNSVGEEGGCILKITKYLKQLYCDVVLREYEVLFICKNVNI